MNATATSGFGSIDRRRLLGWSLATAAVGGLTAVGIAPHRGWAAGPPEPVPGGTFTNLGPAVTAMTLMRGVVGHNAAGQPLLFSVPAGENAHLNGINLVTRQLEVDVPMPGASGSWAMTRATDGSIYVGAYSNGRLYRYQPQTGILTDLGPAAPGVTYLYGVTPGPNAKVYAGTYPYAKVVEYDPATNQFTDFGSLTTVQKYVRSLAYDGDHGLLFAGLFTPVANLIRIDLATGARTDVTPNVTSGTGFTEISYLGGTVLAAVGRTVHAVDPVTGAQKSFTNGETGAQVPTFSALSRHLSQPRNGKSYYTDGNHNLGVLDLATLTFSVVRDGNGAPLTVTGGAMSLDWIVDGSGRDLLVGVAGNYTGDAYQFDPAAATVEVWRAPFAWVPSPMIQILPGRAGTPYAGKVYTCANLNGSSTVYDIAAASFTPGPRHGQVEAWTWHAGKVWMGVYPTGTVKVWDPALPESATNPRTVADLLTGHQQLRLVSLVATGQRLYIGSNPNYGQLGGALTILDLTDETFQVHRNIVADQTIASVLVDGTTGWGGSSISGGTGTTPVATQAVLFRFDPVTGAKAAEYVPVPGAGAINELSLGPDGRIWGLADGTLFVFDQASTSVVATVALFSGPAGYGQGEMAWHPNGHLYVTCQGRLLDVDPLAMTSTTIKDSGTDKAYLGADDRVYLLHRPVGQANLTDLAVFQPATATARPADLRPTVLVGEQDSGVRNRFATDGSTLADLVPDGRDWATHGAFVAAFTAQTRGWLRSGLVSAAERDSLLEAAGRSTVGGA